MTIDFNALPELLSVPDVAALLGLSRSSAYRYAHSGDLPCRHLGGRLYVVKDRLQELLEADTSAPEDGDSR